MGELTLRERHLTGAIERSLWLVLLFGLALLGSFKPASQEANTVIASVSVLFGIRVFIGHGHDRSTVLGVFTLAMSMFVGFAGGWAVLTNDGRVTPEYLGRAILAGFALQVLTALFGWSYRPSEAPLSLPAVEHLRWMTRWGLVILVGLIAADLLGLTSSFSSIAESGAFAAVVVLAIGLILRQNARLLSWDMVVVGAALVCYVEVFHTGGGRLRIVALLVALLLLSSLRWPSLSLKWFVVVVIPPALALFAQLRLSYQESLQYGASSGRNGLESMLIPIVVLGRMIEEQAEGLALAWGWNLLSMPLSYLPSGWMDNRPKALGYELVGFFAPQRYGSEYSLAATAVGEAIYNFGLIGILPGSMVIAWLCNFLDRRMRRSAAHIVGGRAALVRLALWLTLSGAIADLAWNGWHIFAARSSLRLPVLGFLAALAWLNNQAKSGRTRNGQSPRRVDFGVPVGRSETVSEQQL